MLTGVNLEIPERQITVVLGRSGCGKTTLLRLTGGLEKADSGEIRYGGSHRTAFVFQEPRLMPWLTVRQNILFGLRGREKKESGRGRMRSSARWGLRGLRRPIPPSSPEECSSGRLWPEPWPTGRLLS